MCAWARIEASDRVRIREHAYVHFCFYDYCKWIIIANNNNKNKKKIILLPNIVENATELTAKWNKTEVKKKREKKTEKNELPYTRARLSCKKLEFLANRHEPLVSHISFLFDFGCGNKAFMHSSVLDRFDHANLFEFNMLERIGGSKKNILVWVICFFNWNPKCTSNKPKS